MIMLAELYAVEINEALGFACVERHGQLLKKLE